MKLFDSHAHLNFRAYEVDRDKVIKRTLSRGTFFINVGTQYSTSLRAVELAKKYENGVWAAIGLHPLHLQKRTIEYQDDDELTIQEINTNGELFDYDSYKKLVQNDKVVAIGEVGLDYHHFEEGDDKYYLILKQKEILIKLIKLANEFKKPLIIHCWDAYDDLLNILREYDVYKQGVIHSFVGSYKTANKFTYLGYKIGLNGIITYSESFDRLVKEIELENILLETDCPYLAPVPRKGERNEPLFVEEVAKKIAEIKEITVEEVAKITTENATNLFLN